MIFGKMPLNSIFNGSPKGTGTPISPWKLQLRVVEKSLSAAAAAAGFQEVCPAAAREPPTR